MPVNLEKLSPVVMKPEQPGSEQPTRERFSGSCCPGMRYFRGVSIPIIYAYRMVAVAVEEEERSQITNLDDLSDLILSSSGSVLLKHHE